MLWDNGFDELVRALQRVAVSGFGQKVGLPSSWSVLYQGDRSPSCEKATRVALGWLRNLREQGDLCHARTAVCLFRGRSYPTRFEVGFDPAFTLTITGHV
jgi:hypothetical protein